MTPRSGPGVPTTPIREPVPGPGRRHRATADRRRDDDVDTERAGGPAHPDRWLAGVLTVGGAVGTVVAITLLLEKLALLADPGYIASCDVDAVLSCGSVMRTAQASAFGFPNPIIGVATYPLVVVAGALVLGGVALPRWFWLGLQFGATAGVAFVHWLILQTLVVIGALCPYCVVAWAATIAVFWFVTAHNLDAGHLDFGRPGRYLSRRRGAVLAAWYLAVVVAVVAAFPTYWFGS